MAGTPQEIAAAWQTGMSSAGDKIARGVAAVSTAPGAAAARQKSVYISNTQAAADKWARNTAAVTLGDWQSSMITKGAPRIAAGAQAAAPKFADFLTQFLPHVEAGKRALPARGNLEQNIARMTAMVRHNASFQKR